MRLSKSVRSLLLILLPALMGRGIAAASPVTPSFSAAHNPSRRLRRAMALNFCSSSIANFFSKPSSRLSKLLMVKGSVSVAEGVMAARCG